MLLGSNPDYRRREPERTSNFDNNRFRGRCGALVSRATLPRLANPPAAQAERESAWPSSELNRQVALKLFDGGF